MDQRSSAAAPILGWHLEAIVAAETHYYYYRQELGASHSICVAGMAVFLGCVAATGLPLPWDFGSIGTSYMVVFQVLLSAAMRHEKMRLLMDC